MSTTDDEIKIDLDALDDAKVKPNGKAEAKPAADAETKVTPEDGLAKLQKQLDTERAARTESDRAASEARAGEAQARNETQKNHLTIVTTALENIKSSNAVLKTEYAAALAAQDFEKVADIQEAMGDNSARKIQLEAAKTQLEKAPAVKPRESSDPVEQFTANMSPKSASWIRSHPEVVRDNKLNRKMIRAHEDALEDGIQADTPEYFAAIDKACGFGEPIKVVPDTKIDDDSPLSDASAPRRAAPAAAPVSRSGNGAGGRPNVVTLSSAEVEAAAASGISVEEYAKNKASLKKEGRLN